MAKEREPLVGAAIGRRGTGKTYTTIDVAIKDALSGRGGAKPKQVLIIDVNNEYGNLKKNHGNKTFPDIEPISPTDVPRWNKFGKIEARRIPPYIPKSMGGGVMSLKDLSNVLVYILKGFKSGLLIIEDINKYVGNNPKNDIIGAIISTRHKGVDIITHFQSVGKIATPQIWGNLNWVRFHKVYDTVERHKTKFGASVAHLQILEKMVDHEYFNGNERFYAFYNKDTGKIEGDFNKQQFINAVELYLEDNETLVKKTEAKKELRSGKKIHPSRAHAVDHLIKTYVSEFYGGRPDKTTKKKIVRKKR